MLAIACVLTLSLSFGCVVSSSSVIFFFQAEDGIRDLVRSRGLGDVYKRQGVELVVANAGGGVGVAGEGVGDVGAVDAVDGMGAVSYTHLTLPTSDLV